MRTRLLMLLTVLWWTLGAAAQDWETADSLAPAMTDTTNYEAPIQRNFNALQYSLDDYHRFTGDSFDRPLSFFGMGGGRMTINDNNIYNPASVYMMHLSFGRQIDALRSLRLSLNGGVGFIQRHSTNELYSTTNGYFALEGDFLYSISNYLLGYRPERLLDVSGFLGLGVGYSQRFESEAELLAHQLSGHKVTGRLRGGFQLKFFAGPQAALSLEPYAYISTRAIDLVRPEYEFYSYRMGGGIDISYIYYLRNRLTPEGNEGSFRRTLAREQRYLAGDVPAALLHHPLVLSVQGGVAAVEGHGRQFDKSRGPLLSASLSWWLSPVLGVRGQFGVDDVNMSRNARNSGKNAHFYHAGLDLLFNPFASIRHDLWQSAAGMALVAGYEGGRFYDGTGRYPGFGYHGGVHLWSRITDGVALTLEPQYALLTNNGDGDNPGSDHFARVKLGVDVWLGTGHGVGHGAHDYPLGRAGIAIGRGAAAAGVAVGRGVAAAGVATGRGIAAAGVATGRGIAAAGVATGRGLAAAGVATGRGLAAAGVATGRGIATAGLAVGRGVSHAANIIYSQSSRPFFLEYDLGYQHITDMPTQGIDTWEPQIQVGAGWWPTAAFGVRAGADFFRGSSSEREVKASNGTFVRYDKMRLSFAYADLLFNPFGLRRNYNWQSPAGLNLIAGRLIGNLANANIEERYWRSGWRLGGQVWARVDRGLRLHVEPMYTLGECRPQSTDPANYTSADHHNIFSLKVGLTMLMQQKSRRLKTLSADTVARRWFVGVGGGLHFNKDLYRLSGGGTNSNIQLMAGYRLFRNSVVRLAEELTFDHFVEPCTYQLTSGDNAGQRRSGMGVRTYRYLFSALTYQYDLMGLFNENPSRRWEMSPFVGFAVSYYLNETTKVPGESADYTVPVGNRISPANFNVLLGMTLNYRLTERLSAYLSHNLYMYSFGRPQWLHYSNQIRTYSGNINTFNVGLMYNL